MSYDLKTITRAPIPLTFGDISLQAVPLSIDELGELESWIATKLPEPKALARELAEGQSPNTAQSLLLAAYNDIRAGARTLMSPEGFRCVSSLAGSREVLRIALRKFQPDIAETNDALDELIRRRKKDIDKWVAQLVFGEEPEDDKTNEGQADPKAPALDTVAAPSA